MFQIVINQLSRELFAGVLACGAEGRGFKPRPRNVCLLKHSSNVKISICMKTFYTVY
jgi:hypothetical protein